MTDLEILKAVKVRIGENGDSNDSAISGLIEDVKYFMVDADVPESLLTSEKAVGCIALGVADLWNLGAKDGDFSKFFEKRLIQLKLEVVKL